MSLSVTELQQIHDTWAQIYKDPDGYGAIILKTFLDKHDYYHKFARFKDAPRDTILQNPIFRNHASKIIHTLNDVVANIEHVEIVKKKLIGLGSAHAKRKIKRIQFEELIAVILDILKNSLKVTDDQEKAWKKLFSIIAPHIFEGLQM